MPPLTWGRPARDDTTVLGTTSHTFSRRVPDDDDATGGAPSVDSSEVFAALDPSAHGASPKPELKQPERILQKVEPRPAKNETSSDAFAPHEALDLFNAEQTTQHREKTATVPPPIAPESERASLETQPTVYALQAEGSMPSLSPETFTHSERSPRQVAIIAAIVVLSVIAVVQAVLLTRGMRNGAGAPVAAPSTGIVSVQSTPSGAAVSVNGQARGVTPLTLTLNPGDYSIEIEREGVSRALPVTVAAGTHSSQHIVFGGDAQARGGLQISSQPAGARVTIDDVARGVTPLTVTDLSPGTHTVVLDGPSGPSRQSVTIQPGTTASIAVTMPVAGASGGFVRVNSPFDVQLYEDGALIGSSQSERIMLPAGRHIIEAVNSDLAYRSTHTVQVAPGGTANIRVDAPSVSVDVNAVPWADVTIAGRALGTTPLGNVQVPIGAQEVIFRHPQLGERRVVATVTAKGPNRISVNMNQK